MQLVAFQIFFTVAIDLPNVCNFAVISYTLGTYLSCEAIKGSKKRTMDDKVKNNESHLLLGGLSHEML